jgi:RNA polymerase sigma-70 factor (ECF subfamily)
MVRLRMNRKLYGRVDDSDVLQDAFLEISKHLKDYLKDPPMPFYLWLRHITGEKLITVHRQHLGAKKRDAGRDVSLFGGALPPASTASLAAQLLGRLTSPSQAAIKAELRLKLQEALDNLNDIDREVLVLRHFEQLSNSEAAQVLKIQESASSKRYLRALERLQQVMIETRLLE